jgi:hypothetical protein
MACTEGAPEEAELIALAEVINAYEAKCWPSGKVVGGKVERKRREVSVADQSQTTIYCRARV